MRRDTMGDLEDIEVEEDDTSNEGDREIQDNRGKTPVAKVVFVVAPYVSGDKKYAEWSDVMGIRLSDDNIWTGKQTHNGEVASSSDYVITLGDAAGVNKLIIKDSAGTTVATIDSDGELTLGKNKKLILDDLGNTWIQGRGAGFYVEYFVENVEIIRMFPTGFIMLKTLNMNNKDLQDVDNLRMTERAVKPAAMGNKGFIYCKDVAGTTELFFERDDGTEVQIS